MSKKYLILLFLGIYLIITLVSYFFIKADNITEELKPKVLGIITLFTWLGRVDKQRDHSKLLKNIWLCVKFFDTKMFWSKETVQRAMIKDEHYEILTK